MGAISCIQQIVAQQSKVFNLNSCNNIQKSMIRVFYMC